MVISKHDAIFAFVISLLCLIPWLNIFVSPISLGLGLYALYKIKHHPKTHGGKRFAIAAIVISGLAIVLSILGFFLGVF